MLMESKSVRVFAAMVAAFAASGKAKNLVMSLVNTLYAQMEREGAPHALHSHKLVCTEPKIVPTCGIFLQLIPRAID